jgi:16S rRNA (uracil1498-N3)-methyltransferase
MHRFYLPPAQCAGNQLRLTDREAHHALHVLRLRNRETVTILDGAGQVIECEVTALTRTEVTLQVHTRNGLPPLPCQITLIQALPKGKIMETIIQKAVELGAHRVLPILSERVVSQLDEDGAEGKREKWRQVAVEAIKQSGAAWLPVVSAPVTLARYLARPEAFDLALIGSLQAERCHPRHCLAEYQTRHRRPPGTVGMWVGPEGDFTPAEVVAIQATGAQPITLGRLVLRVETAAIYCLSVLNYELNLNA